MNKKCDKCGNNIPGDGFPMLVKVTEKVEEKHFCNKACFEAWAKPYMDAYLAKHPNG